MKLNLLKIIHLIIFTCSIFSHMRTKEDSNTLLSLFGKIYNNNKNKNNKNYKNKNFRFSEKNKEKSNSFFDPDSEISLLEKQAKNKNYKNMNKKESNIQENFLEKSTYTNEPASSALDTDVKNDSISTFKKINHTIEITEKTILSDWLTIDSEFFRQNKFPLLKTNPGQAKISLKENARINEKFLEAKKEGAKSDLFFWFKFNKGYFYYFATKDNDMNILDAILIKTIEDNYIPGDGNSQLPTCFNIYDFQSNRFTLCALDMDIKLKYLCSIQNYLKIMEDDRCKPEINNGESKLEIKKEYKNIVIIPIASRNCNQKWDYSNKGSDWECTCKDGISQSPINLPSKQASFPSTLAPMFSYERVDIKPNKGSIDGFIEGSKNIKIRYEKNAIRIFHPNMGKIVNIDGSVYNAEEIVFHTPSEHTIDGKQFELEMQVIHYGQSKGAISNQIVLSVLFKNSPGKFNKFLDKIDFFNLPNPKDPEIEMEHDFFIPSVFIDSDEEDIIGMEPFSFYTYEGSLSFPPCTERTTYFVAADPVPLSNTVIQFFKEALSKPTNIEFNEKGEISSINQTESDNENNREIQPTNGRLVYLFDHIMNGCVTYKPPKAKIQKAGHFEKVRRTAHEYILVNGNKPSGIPGSFIVSEEEALGKKNNNIK
jgi:carbonic anhydrase